MRVTFKHASDKLYKNVKLPLFRSELNSLLKNNIKSIMELDIVKFDSFIDLDEEDLTLDNLNILAEIEPKDNKIKKVYNALYKILKSEKYTFEDFIYLIANQYYDYCLDVSNDKELAIRVDRKYLASEFKNIIGTVIEKYINWEEVGFDLILFDGWRIYKKDKIAIRIEYDKIHERVFSNNENIA